MQIIIIGRLSEEITPFWLKLAETWPHGDSVVLKLIQNHACQKKIHLTNFVIDLIYSSNIMNSSLLLPQDIMQQLTTCTNRLYTFSLILKSDFLNDVIV